MATIIAIYTSLFALFLIVGWNVIVPTIPVITQELSQLLPSSSILQRFVVFVGWFMWLLTIPLLLVFSCILLFSTGKFFTFPLLERLATQVESSYGYQAVKQDIPITLSAYFYFNAIECIINILLIFFLYVPMLLVSFIPIAGNIISFTFGSLMISQEMIGLPLSRIYTPYKHRWDFVVQHKWIALGFGFGVLCFSTIPGLHLLFLPIAAIGGTLIHCDISQTHEKEN